MKKTHPKTNAKHAGVASSPTPGLPPSEELIRKRAYGLYLARGGADGMDLNDWLTAERDLKKEFER